MWPNPSANLVTFIEEILNDKLDFLRKNYSNDRNELQVTEMKLPNCQFWQQEVNGLCSPLAYKGQAKEHQTYPL